MINNKPTKLTNTLLSIMFHISRCNTKSPLFLFSNAFYFSLLITFEFESIGQLIAHCHLILSIREQLVNKQTAAEKERERIGLELRQRKNEQSVISLDCSIKLAQQQTRLDNIRAQAYRMVSMHTFYATSVFWNILSPYASKNVLVLQEDVMKRIQSTAAKETLLLGQIRVTILNLYYMISKGPVDVENTFAQLEKVNNAENTTNTIQDN